MHDEIGGVGFNGICSSWGANYMREIHALGVQFETWCRSDPTVRHVLLVGRRTRRRMGLPYSCSSVMTLTSIINYQIGERTRVCLRVLRHGLCRVRGESVRRAQGRHT